jgi:deazaflavin-dependent oxidoreductase (nitroreductase family)
MGKQNGAHRRPRQVNGTTQAILRRLTQVTRPLAMRSAGTETSDKSIVRHVGRRSGRAYETPVVAIEHDDGFLIALPYGQRTDWVKNVVADGVASVVSHGQTYRVDHPQVIPMAEATTFFGTKEQKLHRRFAVATCLQVHLTTA